MPDKKCQERIQDHYDGRLADAEEIFRAIDGKDEVECPECNEPVDVDTDSATEVECPNCHDTLDWFMDSDKDCKIMTCGNCEEIFDAPDYKDKLMCPSCRHVFSQPTSEYKDADEAYERLNELPLSVDVEITMKVLLSTGGPADYLTAEVRKSSYSWERVSNVTYHFADWWDHAEMQADGDMERLFDYYLEGLSVDV